MYFHEDHGNKNKCFLQQIQGKTDREFQKLRSIIYDVPLV